MFLALIATLGRVGGTVCRFAGLVVRVVRRRIVRDMLGVGGAGGVVHFRMACADRAEYAIRVIGQELDDGVVVGYVMSRAVRLVECEVEGRRAADVRGDAMVEVCGCGVVRE